MKKAFWPKIIICSLWVVTAIAIFRSFLFPLFDPDLWWHLAAGRTMIENHQFLRTDIFSYTMHGIPWTNFEWLTEAAAFSIYRIGGLSGIYWTKVILCSAVVAVLIACLREARARGPAFIFFSWIGFLVLRPRLFERPELITYLFLGIFTWWTLRLRSNPESRSRLFVTGIFVLMVIWVNAHGGFVYGLSLLFCFDLGARWTRARPSLVASLDRAFTLALLAVLMSPHGIRIGSLIAELMVGFGQYRGVIQEWGPASLKGTPYFWGLFFSALAGMGVTLYQKKSPLRFWFPALILFGMWGASSHRNTALFVFPALPFLVEVLEAKKIPTFRFQRVFTAVAWAACLLVVALKLSLARTSIPREKIAWEKFPRGADNFLGASSIKGRMYNSYAFGGYLEWTGGPQRLIFKDGRYPFFPLESEENKMSLGIQKNPTPQLWQNYLNNWAIAYAVVEYPRTLFHFLKQDAETEFSLPVTNFMFPRQQWALLYWDDTALVFVRRVPQFESIIRNGEYKVVRPYSLAQMQFLIKKRLISVEDLNQEICRQENEVGPTKIVQTLKNLISSAIGPDSPNVGLKTPR